MSLRSVAALTMLASAPVAAACAIRFHRATQRWPVFAALPAHAQRRDALLVESLGRRVRGVLGRPTDAAHDLTIGRMLIVVPIAAAIDTVFGAFVFVYSVARPLLVARRRLHSHTASLVRELPEIVDLYSVALNSGHNLATASREVAQRADGIVAAALTEAVARTERGQPLDVALDDLSADLGPTVRPLTSVLVAGMRYGVPVAASLERVAADLRLERRRQAERAARRLPVVMLFPLVFCVLPAFGLLTIVPVLIESLESLSL